MVIVRGDSDTFFIFVSIVNTGKRLSGVSFTAASMRKGPTANACAETKRRAAIRVGNLVIKAFARIADTVLFIFPVKLKTTEVSK
jgi:hypothetical protein